ncbi:hypothetical protein [Bartonella raoultii]|uniref:hypothetical protein n=1 Tax=Bartonella raoultii TaxID=1457020 RepID=UPI001C7DEA11|nr:hypothetical protein [Bartonella raoultii]
MIQQEKQRRKKSSTFAFGSIFIARTLFETTQKNKQSSTITFFFLDAFTFHQNRKDRFLKSNLERLKELSSVKIIILQKYLQKLFQKTNKKGHLHDPSTRPRSISLKKEMAKYRKRNCSNHQNDKFERKPLPVKICDISKNDAKKTYMTGKHSAPSLLNTYPPTV